jgi:hypothetical protein
MGQVTMQAAFVSFQYRSVGDPLLESERRIEAGIESLLTDHGLRAVTGERLGGELITDGVRRRITQSDCLVAVLSRRDALTSGDRWTTSEWVKAEIDWARSSGKRSIALLEDGVRLAGPGAGYENIPLDREDLLPALMALSRTIGTWCREAGYLRKVRLFPDSVGQELRRDRRLECRYRQRRGLLAEPWRTAEPVVEPGGTFVYAEGIFDDAAIEVEILEDSRPRWWSPATPQFVPVELREA